MPFNRFTQEEADQERNTSWTSPKRDTHQFVPHRKFPWFCQICGYAPHEVLQHGQQKATDQ